MESRVFRVLTLLCALALLLPGCGCDGATGLQEGRGVIAVDATDLDFGPVPEGTREVRVVRVSNAGVAPLDVTPFIVELSGDFALIDRTLFVVAPGGSHDLEVAFTPVGSGSDEGTLRLSSTDPLQPELDVRLTGGPIAPELDVDPNPVVFTKSGPLVEKQVTLLNVGLAKLRVSAVGVDPTGSPDFSIVPPGLPKELPPSQSFEVTVSYAPSTREDEGRMEVHSNDPAGEVTVVPLVPDPVSICSDGTDNDGDGLTDYPDDPGCVDAEDGDEYNPPECVNGAVQPCGTDLGVCSQGTRTCASSIWGPCEGANVGTDEVCNNEDDDCDGVTDEEASRPCDVNGCAGAEACVVDSGVPGGSWSGTCAPVSAVDELCDGEDNDCDALIDEAVIEACTSQFGCVGTRTCRTDGSGQFDPCVPDVPPGETTCDNLDDDCDGLTDEALTMACGSGNCAGTRTCVTGTWQACQPALVDPESCNGIDDDCDGDTDEALTRACTRFGCAGTQSCELNGSGTWLTCVPTSVSTETCNGADDDCDGSVDEGLTRSCMVFGCAGTETCDPAGTGGWLACTPNNPGTETCDGTDQDCDGSTDELVTRACVVNACPGTDACDGIGGWQNVCTPVSTDPESCDGVDNDCDGTTDEGITGQPCSVNGCAGTRDCVVNGGGAWTSCVATSPGTETCDGTDEDCDGLTDEGVTSLFFRDLDTDLYGDPNDARAACTAPVGYVGNNLDCNDTNQNIKPGAAELCDTVNNDCDASTPDGADEAWNGAPCDGPDADACPEGTYGCVAGSQSCSDTTGNTAEICNALDDDCDAATDEGVTTTYYFDNDGDLYGDPLVTTAACSQPVGYVANDLDCNDGDPNVKPGVSDLCNGVDDDCSAATPDGSDEAWYGEPCDGADTDLCEEGTLDCSSALQVCTDLTGDTLEANCDSVDEDCDGMTDEGLGCGACDPDNPGTYLVTSVNGNGGQTSFALNCAFGLVNLNINRFTFSGDGATISSSPTNPNAAASPANQPLLGTATTCPSGSFSNTRTIPGGCNEIFTLTGSFTGNDTWSGTYTVQFTGSCFDCVGQSWTLTAQR